MQKLLLTPLFSLLFLLALPQAASAQNSPNRVTLQHGQEIFVSGINVAWHRFGADVGDQPLDTAWFATMLQAVSDSGGNAVRWWLFTNASRGPVFDPVTKLVTGPGSATIPNIRKMLDMAHARGVVVSLCLLSFDMLKYAQQGVDTAATLRMLLTDEGRRAFVDNALVPLVTAIGPHPAILTWEVFNEPEGMVKSIAGDWGEMADGVEMVHVQKMVNWAAGAIHRAMPGIPVTNGCWSFIVHNDIISGNRNYYTDSALVATGGDPDGTLDFYQIHYYEWAGRRHSPFHNPASYWGLDKPIVIGEFSAHGLSDSLGPLSPQQAWQYLYDNGYAGALGWTYTAHDGHGSLADAAGGTRWLVNTDPAAAVIDFPPLAGEDWYAAHSGAPLQVAAPGVLANDRDPTPDAVLSAAGISTQPSNGIATLQADGSFTYTPQEGFRGYDFFVYRVQDGNGVGALGTVHLQVFDPAVEQLAVPGTASQWRTFSAWGTHSVSAGPGGALAANHAQWGGSSLWVVGNADPTRITLETGTSYTVAVTLRNDSGSPWDTLFFLATTNTDSYGPTEAAPHRVLLNQSAPTTNGYTEYRATFVAEAGGTFQPALLLAWDAADGNGPSNAHTTLIRSLVIVADADYIPVVLTPAPSGRNLYTRRISLWDLVGRKRK